MRLKNKIKNICYAVILLTGTASCADWLDVKMEDSVMENTLFQSNEGYQIALNGVYLDMISLYVNNMTTSVIDVMAQYYNVTENNDHTYKVYANYKFNDQQFEGFRESVWTKAYNLIANVNVILEHCDEENAAVNKDFYPIVKGEALALRAMLHFDVLRLFGPVPNAESANEKCIPYCLSSSKDIQPLQTSEKVLGLVIADLEKASELLKDNDPIVTEGIRNEEQNDNGLSNNNLNYRQLRLNYYAVQLLLARAYSWKGDRNKAYSIAKNNIINQITDEEKEIFPWVKESAIHADGKPDHLYSSEVFFAIYNSRRSSVYSQLFSPSLRALSGRLTFVGSNYGDSKFAFFYDDENDWRREMWDITEAKATEEGKEDETSLYLKKFSDFEQTAQAGSTDLYRYMMPLIRLSEAYLIAAEGAPTREEAFQFINTLRLHRACRDLPDDGNDLQDIITAEFAREVIGEGQLFFYYKRNAMERIASGTTAGATYGMTLSNYVLPLPPSETDKRVMN